MGANEDTNAYSETRGQAMTWYKVWEELPPCDGVYEVSYGPEIECEYTTGYLGKYNGFEFHCIGQKGFPRYWRYPVVENREKRYGKVRA
jgi:hypothetical protein